MDFTVEWFSRDIESGSAKFGWADLNRQKIFISDDLTPGKVADTFMHEVLHVLNWIFDIDDGVKEESLCLRLSSGLLAFWRDNPEAMRWLEHVLLSQKGSQR
jgi:hypothetical protein